MCKINFPFYWFCKLGSLQSISTYSIFFLFERKKALEPNWNNSKSALELKASEAYPLNNFMNGKWWGVRMSATHPGIIIPYRLRVRSPVRLACASLHSLPARLVCANRDTGLFQTSYYFFFLDFLCALHFVVFYWCFEEFQLISGML